MMIIGIIGMGFVGDAVYQKFKLFGDVLYNDIIAEKSIASINEIVSKTNYIFLCLPTPMNKDGSCNINIIENTLKEIVNLGYDQYVIIKSTVIPGTTDYLAKKFKSIKVIHNPEFLTERNSVNDYTNQKRIILGGKKANTKSLKKIFNKVFSNIHIIEIKAIESEIIKYFINTFLATKVSFANEIFEICSRLDIDYQMILKIVLGDDRIGKSHLNVPGHDGKLGFGGSCFPKDLRALMFLANQLNISLPILNATFKKNTQLRKQKQ